ncbi:MAG: tRNA adenosine(34) deaminase TadA [Candidatus Thiodiazotropha sp. (ex Lucinoma aequizonata)]|nr:tRNA adenosine(34) deaminase TadA [Candidatus Thiodiazotropha sp. (ex Lucinoma aequizonata)]MCU7890048.1 tRNA adenosine(34) deaminase TadA [Candidatus Thiodiazotropha sp. (ex Lucinoma aequizonata)]MCU7894805.1 tRNA adenosine(34) deaminase TadA [Candidatus Thiodiazotropha sp. (ex Lucinoma aequizonata)]MCU7897706.1 tRNA adenosine(34) deaminase TadA [Candidatus Thiodiazotropha sp. (ex Lucinoma aequizonata)]MCU7901490.1 tRNA adenosine(34) deaminase TadA [Candidatus Thiodiazotropha sp. (ex Lucino
MPASDRKLTDQQFMQHALLLAERAESQGEVPVGALVVLYDQIIGEGWNHPITLQDPTAHAEIMALRDATTKRGNYRLPETTLYVTLEPCPMCAGAIVHARVGRVVYGASDPKGGAAGSVFKLLPTDTRFNHRVVVDGGVLQATSTALLRDFFRRKRTEQKTGVITTEHQPSIFPCDADPVG